ncbi:MAG: hypothetical protein ACYS4W_15520 [Planctomycetota bacterium]
MRTSVLSLLVLMAMLFSLAILASGCSQPGETTAEGSRRHSRALRINQQELIADLDAFLLLDKPSKLTDKRVP